MLTVRVQVPSVMAVMVVPAREQVLGVVLVQVMAPVPVLPVWVRVAVLPGGRLVAVAAPVMNRPGFRS